HCHSCSQKRSRNPRDSGQAVHKTHPTSSFSSRSHRPREQVNLLLTFVTGSVPIAPGSSSCMVNFHECRRRGGSRIVIPGLGNFSPAAIDLLSTNRLACASCLRRSAA